MQNKSLTVKQLTLPVTLLLIAALRPLALVTGALLPGAAEQPMLAEMGQMLRELLVWGLPAAALRPWRSRNIETLEAGAGWYAAALALGVLTQAGMSAVMQMLGVGGANAIPMPESGAEWTVAVLALAVTPALVEEAFFRGSLLCCLATKAGNRLAFAVTLLTFALLHGSWEGLPAHLAVSCLCTLLMLATGRLALPVLFHLGFNASGLLLPLLGIWPWQAALLIPVGAAAALLGRCVCWEREGLGLRRWEWAVILLILAGSAARYFL